MGLVHQTLYGDTNFTTLSFGRYLEGLVAHLKRAHLRGDTVDVGIEADDSHFELDQSMPLALIANEVVTNALKHGLGAIRIVLRTERDRTTLEVANTGGNAAPRPDAASGSGLQIVRALATQLHGDVAAGPEGEGWHFRLVFARTTAQRAPASAPGPAPTAGSLAIA
jgi:two-component sensor histidine kinase